MQNLGTKIKKVGAAVGSALMVGATLGAGAVLADFPTPFVTDGVIQSQIVVGSQGSNAAGLASDIAGAINIGAALGNAAIVTETKTKSVAGGAGTGFTVTDGKDISSVNEKLYFGDSISKSGLRNTLTKNDLPEMLASGQFVDDSGTTSSYDEYILLNSSNVLFGRSGGDMGDPDMLLTFNAKSGSNAALYGTKVVFNKAVNISDSDVHSNTLKLFGTTWTIGSNSRYDASTKKLELFGSSNKHTLGLGEEVVVSLDGVDHTIKLDVVSSATQAYVIVDGVGKTVTTDRSYTVNSVAIFVDDVVLDPSSDSSRSRVQLSIGSQKLILQEGNAVKVGESEDTVDGTEVSLVGTAGTGISSLTVYVWSKDSNKDWIKAGESFSDPVWDSFKVAFGGLAVGTTDTVKVDNAGSNAAAVSFTDWRGNAKTLNFAYKASGNNAPTLKQSSSNSIVVVENTTISKNDYFLLAPNQESEFSHIFQYTSSSSIGSSGAEIEIRDYSSGETIEVALTAGSNTEGTLFVDGQQYNVKAYASGDKIAMTWGTGATATNPGNTTMVYPLIQLAGGEWMTFTANITFLNATPASGARWLDLPGGVLWMNTSNVGAKTLGRVLYDTWNASGGFVINTRQAAGYSNPDGYPGVLLYEEKAENIAGADAEDYVYIGLDLETDNDLAVQGPFLSAATNTTGTDPQDNTYDSDNSITGYYDRRGTFVKYDNENEGFVEIMYPDEQAVAGLAVGPNPVLTEGGSTSTTVEYTESSPSAVPDLALVDRDAAVSVAKTSKNLIVVGGPAVNALTDELSQKAGSGVWDLATWRDGSHANKAQVVLVEDAFTSGKAALVVAGYEKENTRMASKLLKDYQSYGDLLASATGGKVLELTGTTLPAAG